VIGAGPGSYSELAYNASGSSSLKTNSLQLVAQGIMTLDAQPMLLASPKSAEVALVTSGDSSSVVVATGAHTLQVRQLFVGTNTSLGAVTVGSTPDAATYMQPRPFPGGDGSTPAPAPLVAVGDVVMGTIYAPPANTKQPACKLGGGTIQVRALGAVAGASGDDILVWNGADGKLHRYDGGAFNGCADANPVPPTASTTDANKPAFLPGHGSQILPIEGTRVLLQGHQDPALGTSSFLQVYDVAAMAPVGNPVTTAGARSAAILTVGATHYAVVGYPGALVDGTASGQVLVYAISSSGLDSGAPAAMLHDAQPEGSQQFGRSVAVMPFNGKQVIAVAAQNEIFVYFRAKLSDGQGLYDETRQGR
jgi:hypothetical protein